MPDLTAPSMPADATVPSPPEGLPPGRRGWAMATVLIAVGLATLDTAIANTALPTIAADLHASPAASVWVVNAYQLALVATVLPFAALGDKLGYRRIYIGGLAVFTVASAVCALSWSLPTLAVARVLQGLGASGIMSVNVALIRFIYPPAMLGRGVGNNALVVAIAFAVGPTVASAILSVAPWPYLFAINVPLGALAVAIALPTLPRTPLSDRRFDLPSAVLNAVTFSLFVITLAEASHAARLRIVLPLFAVFLLVTLVFLRRQLPLAAPMLPIDLFRRPLFTLSAVTAVCSFAAQGLAFVSLPFFFQNELGRSAVDTGLLMTPWPVVVAIMAPIAGRLSDHYPPAILGGVGMAGLALGMLLLGALPAHPTTPDIIWRMAICGAGFGFFQSPNLRALMTSAPPERSGGASGVVATSRLLGQASGAALVAACFSIEGVQGPSLALLLGAGFSGAASVASFMRLAAR
ncbi:MFS transporter [Acidisphaera rubrifaciens]|uniref:Transporter n=1 Tax=Acidisphaera rubrifaciens HS-AP3 TaxID=1231350 RepID=A0A0D6PAR4_9PROT|nr:MFS transporter [Acidisphaera rubrifaciens]GAN77964.1 transporter [Acidisphaera rubrifaciens HS-AP3]